MKKLLPIILLLIGSGVGVGAGIFLRPESGIPEMSEAEMKADAETHKEEKSKPGTPSLGFQYVKMSNQFVVPIVQGERIASMVVMSLSIEAAQERTDIIYDKEPKLRDAFLSVMFDHANIGGFDGTFTDVNRLAVLRKALREVAQKALGADIVNDVLIVDMARQDY